MQPDLFIMNPNKRNNLKLRDPSITIIMYLIQIFVMKRSLFPSKCTSPNKSIKTDNTLISRISPDVALASGIIGIREYADT